MPPSPGSAPPPAGETPRPGPASPPAAGPRAVPPAPGPHPPSGSSRVGLVDVAPAPVLVRLERLDDGVADQTRMLPGVPVRRGVAAPDVPAGQAQPQVHPRGPHLQALLAALRGARDDVLAHEDEVGVDSDRDGHR